MSYIPVHQKIVRILLIRLKPTHILRVSENDNGSPCFFVPDQPIQVRQCRLNRGRFHLPRTDSEKTALVLCIHQHFKLVIAVQRPMRQYENGIHSSILRSSGAGSCLFRILCHLPGFPDLVCLSLGFYRIPVHLD